ncbi:LysR substrate-binding domain-containing protein [Rhizobium sp. LEGMi198b]
MSKLRHMLPSTHSLFVFEAAARNLNFKLAAAELNVTQSSISHSIKALERHCKIDLFLRDNRGVQLTAAGRQLYEDVRAGFGRIEQRLRAITTPETQYITIAASSSMAAHWLVPNLPGFQQLHPKLKIKIVTTDRDIEPDHEVDLTIWLRPKGLQRQNSWHVADEVVFPVCSPLFLQAAQIRSVEDLVAHQLIHSFDPNRKRMSWSEWLDLVGLAPAEIEPNLVFNDYQLAMQAALAGEGLALGWSLTAQFLLRKKMLVRPLDQEIRTNNAFYLIAGERCTKLDEIMPLVDWILAEAGRA